MIHARVIKVKNPEEMGKVAADLFEALIQTKPACVLGLATAARPVRSISPGSVPPTWTSTRACPGTISRATGTSCRRTCSIM